MSAAAERAADLYLGADCGQTHSMAALVDGAGNILGVGRGGACNHFDPQGGEAGFCRAVEEITRRAFASAGLEGEQRQVAAACFGLSDNWDRAQEAIRACVECAWLEVVEDVIAAHSGALAGEAGIVVLAGTGSVAYGVSPRGTTARAGGWGAILGDEGAGYVIGLQALRRAAKASDGRGEATRLTQWAAGHLGYPDLMALNQALLAGSIGRTQIASLTPLVARAAREGDAVAQQIFARAGEDLAQCVLAVARRLEWRDPSVSFAGGVFAAGEVILQPFRRALSAALPQARLLPPRYPPLLGAALLALRLGGKTLTPDLLAALDRACRTRGM
ncbi:MAG: hypothetical protein HPY45_14970 [Anaerolineae bacterium]|nr:hypothetical protein [Anaerolineae bacterium]